MTTFKKLALATAIAAAPFAQAELTSIDDSVLSEMTGQAGISIELSAAVSIGSVVYTDDGVDTTLSGGTVATAGSLALNNIVLGGYDAATSTTATTGNLDEIKIDIDVDGNDGLVIHLGGTDTQGVLNGLNPVDFGLSVGSVAVNSSATLASNIFIAGNLGPIDVTIANDSTIGVEAFFEVTNGSMNVDVMGMGISNLTVGDNGAPFINNANSNYAYLKASVEGANFGALNDGAPVTAATAGLDADADGFISTAEWVGAIDADADGTVTVLEADNALAGGTGAITTQIAQNSASGLAGVSSMAYVGMTISTADTLYISGAGVTTNVSQALNINIDAMNMDVAMDVSLGGTGIGNVAINDLNLTGTSLKIYGH